MLFQETVNDILDVIHKEEPFLRSLTPEEISGPRNHQNRTVKMLVGHLVDSASNNHQRMIRLQYAPRLGYCLPGNQGERGFLTFPDYTQDNDLWIDLNNYQNEDFETILNLWKYFNLHIAHLISSVRKERLDSYWLDF